MNRALVCFGMNSLWHGQLARVKMQSWAGRPCHISSRSRQERAEKIQKAMDAWLLLPFGAQNISIFPSDVSLRLRVLRERKACWLFLRQSVASFRRMKHSWAWGSS